MPVSLYVDATSGGMILQVLLSGFVGGFVMIKLFWRDFLSTVLRRKPGSDEPPSVEPPVPDTEITAG
ncbi:MAG: hypothetical protein WD904_11405 [Dehalococcoidia bacterium]